MADITFTIDVDTDAAINSAKSLQDEIRDLFNQHSSGKLEHQLDKIKLQINQIITKQEKAKAGMADVLKKDFGNTFGYNKVLEKVEMYSKQVAIAKKNVEELGKTAPGTDGFNDAVKQLEKYTKLLDVYQRLQLRMEKQGKDKIDPTTTQEYKDYVNQIENGNNKLRMHLSAANAILNTTEKTGNTAEKNVAKTEKRFSSLIAVIKKIPGLIAKGVSALGKMASKMLGVNKASEKHNTSLKKMITQVLKYGLGIRSIFILWRKLRAYTSDALKLMATQFREVDEDVSALMNSFNQMKLSFGTMAQPLMRALRPALIYIIELITRAMNALANFFAILTGQKYIYKAQKANDSYADSIGGVGKAAKDANKQLAEYDNLLVISQQNEGSGGGGGGAAEGLTGTFEKTLAESNFAKALKEAIEKDDWEGVGGLFAAKLNTITGKFDEWINNSFRPKAVNIADKVARILNGLVDGWNSKLAGQTLADGLNALLDTANTFLTKFDFTKLGVKIGRLIDGFFTKLDPKLLGRTLANRINAIIDFATGLINTTPWKRIGTKLGTALKTFFETIKWEDLGADLTNLASGILDALAGFIEGSNLGTTVGTAINRFLNGIDFAKLATSLSDCAKSILDAIADFIITVDWKRVGEAIAEFLTHIDWLGLLEKLGEVALALLGGLAEALSGLASNPKAIMTIGSALLAIFAVKKIWSMLTGLFGKNLTTSLSSGLSIAKLAVSAATFDLAGRLGGTIFSGIASLFGEEELAKEYGEFAKGPVKYVVNTISEAVKAGKEYSETTGRTTLSNAIHMLFGEDITGMALKSSKDALDAAQEQMYRSIYEFDVLGFKISDEDWEKFKQSSDDWVEQIYKMKDAANDTGDAVEEMKGDIITAGEDIGTSTEKYQYMADELERLSELYPQINPGQLSGILSTSWDLFPEDTEDRLTYVTEQIENLVGTVQDGEEKVTSSVENVGNVIELTGDKYKYMSEMIEELSQTYSNINPGQLASIISTAFDLFPGDTTTDLYNRSKYVQQMIEMLTRTIDTSSDEMAESVSGASRSITTDFNNTKQSIVNSAKESITGIKDEWNNADVKGYFTERSNDITTSFDNVPSDLSTTFDNALNGVKTSFTQDALTDHFTAVKENIETPFKSLPQFFNDTFKESWDKAESAFSEGNTTFSNFNSKISEGMTNTINGLIDGLNGAVATPFRKIQEVIEKFKNMKIGTSAIFSSIPSFSGIPSIPHLAQGAVIPPNREFLAMLGDQTQGTNIETPLETMVQAFKQALSEMGSSNNQNIVLQLDGRTVAECVWDEEDKRYKQTGRR